MQQIYLLYGEEDFLIRQELEQLKKPYAPEAIEVYSDKTTQEQLIETLSLPALFNPERLLIVKGYDFSQAELLLAALKNMPLGIKVVFLLPGKLDKRSKVYKFIKEHGKIIETKAYAPWEQDQLVAWIKRYCQQANKTITSDNALLLSEIVGPSLTELSSEVDKLITYIDDREGITTSDIKALVISSRIEAFALVNALRDKNKSAALQNLERLFNESNDTFPLIGLIAQQFRLLLGVKILAEKKLDPWQIAKELKANPYYVKKTLTAVKNFSVNKLKDNLTQLLAADLNLKSGHNPRVVLPLLINNLL